MEKLIHEYGLGVFVNISIEERQESLRPALDYALHPETHPDLSKEEKQEYINVLKYLLK